MHTTWYLSAEWQMTIFIAPPLIYLMWKFGRKTTYMIAGITLLASLLAVKIAHDYKFIAREIDM